MHPQHSVDLATLKALVLPIARDAIDLPYYEPLDAGPPIMAMFALVLQNEDVARKAMRKMLGSTDYSSNSLVGDTAVMIGEFLIAQKIISILEDSHDRDYVDRGYDFYGYEAGDIAVRLPDTSSAMRLMNKFERSDHHYGAALNIALTLGDIDGINRLLRLILEQGLTGLSPGALKRLFGTLMRAVPSNHDLLERWVKTLIADWKDEPIEYQECVGKLAATIGGELDIYASLASHRCFNHDKDLEGMMIDAIRGEIAWMENLIDNHAEETGLGDILGVLARKQPRFVLKMTQKLLRRYERESQKHYLALGILWALEEKVIP